MYCHCIILDGLPVIDEDGVLKGIITNRDLKYLELDDTKVEKVMTKDNLVTAKVGTSLEEAKKNFMAASN